MELEDQNTEAAEAPAVTPATKFAVRGFAAAPPVEDAPAEDEVPLTDGEEAFAMPAEDVPADEAVATGVTDEAPAEEEAIVIGGKKFATKAEAWSYAEELERQSLANDAFRQGLEAAKIAAPGNTPAPAPQEEEVDPEFWTNPQSYLKKEKAKIIAAAKAEIAQDAAAQAKTHQTWVDFYTDYPDLAGAEKLVNLTLAEDWSTLQHMETKKALKIVAEKTRAERKKLAEALLPKTALPSTRARVSAGSGKNVTPPAAEQKPSTFVAQMKKLKR